MTRQKNQRQTNGHAGPHDRTIVNGGPDRVGPNGHAPASTERGGIPVHRDRAASDDASGASVACAATSSAADGTDRKAHAEAAPPRPNGELRESARKKTRGNGGPKKIPPGEYPLPADPGEFVEEIHKKIDLTEVWHDLLRSKDTKIKQRAVERLTDLRYKGASTSVDEPQQIIFDLPRPKRD